MNFFSISYQIFLNAGKIFTIKFDCQKNFFFIKKQSNDLVREFIRFALSEAGTQIVKEVGTSLPIASGEREKILKNLE